MEQDQLPQTTQPAPEQSAVSALDKDTQLFVGKNADYYARKWAKRSETGQPKISWNAAAFLISPVWMLYRKMYWQTAAYFVVAVLLQLLMDAVIPAGGTIVANLFPFVLGICGNVLYHEHVQRRITKLRARGLSPDALDAVLSVEGGTNPVAAWILAIVITVGLVSMILYVTP